jgi:hypothetical protein
MGKSMADIVEKKIVSSMRKIRNKQVTPKESGIGKMFVRMKDLDEALYEELIVRYKKVLQDD